MHPYQDQVNRMWPLIEKYSRAIKNAYWIETLCLSYTLLEMGLRLLLSSKAGPSQFPPPRADIDRYEYLSTLANFARDEGYLEEALRDRIMEFNNARRLAIHRLAQGEISYDDLEATAKTAGQLMGDIQEIWLPKKIGEEEKRPE